MQRAVTAAKENATSPGALPTEAKQCWLRIGIKLKRVKGTTLILPFVRGAVYLLPLRHHCMSFLVDRGGSRPSRLIFLPRIPLSSP